MFPKFIMIRQEHPSEKLTNVSEAIRVTMKENVGETILSDLREKRVGIAVGSRGITNLPDIVRTLVQIVRDYGGEPIVFAAMGSHGDGQAKGQREVLASLGITEDAVGATIETCAESVSYGFTEDGMEVYGNSLALQYDRIILMNRIKEHTDFEDITESGIFKLMAIGIGNPKGARIVHSHAISEGYGPVIRNAGALILKKLPVSFALAVTENWKHETDSVEAILPENLLEAEMRILAGVKKRAIRLPVDQFDSLIVEEAGKQFSGTCIDTKVVGRIMIRGQKEPESPKIKTIAVLDVTEETHGNTMGLGIADVITRRLFDKINIHATGLTGMTSSCLLQAKIPCVVPTDQDAIDAAFTACGTLNFEDVDSVLIRNTSSLEYLCVSEHLFEKLKRENRFERDLRVCGEPFPLSFDDAGNMRAVPWQH
ncbi:MAG: DUF362 domain-containing protein [Eubacteriales bacterium]|nr:DUF362 domain-containing protein [Eubacteriales bacterium]